MGNYVSTKPARKPNAAEKKVLNDLGRAGQRLMGFCRTNLFKRLESGGPAFLQSLERHILRNFIFLHALENNLDLPLGTQEAELLDVDGVGLDEDLDTVLPVTNALGDTGDLFDDDEALIQKLDELVVTLDEDEQSLTVTAVASKARKGFDVEHVTKKFYDDFKKQHATFLDFIEGIPASAPADREWYASLMLNRLMFIYFIQRKGFLAGDPDYLRHKLEQVGAQFIASNNTGVTNAGAINHAPTNFYGFYRSFLLSLFHDGLGNSARNPVLSQLLGEVPYLNGGLFDVHQLERTYTAIDIPDQAFKLIFDFFDRYQWHLDERPLKGGEEINPDILGYIFEKYINQKQMGTYYTKEDITEYISKNTIIPYLFDAARHSYPEAFEPDSPLWQLLAADPDRYIYEAVRKGTQLPLPPHIAVGRQNMHKREDWNKAAASDFALPTEIWREIVARRERYEEVSGRLAGGEIVAINDLITFNLDMRLFAQDALEFTDDPEFLGAFYVGLQKVTVLNPTCGSGAFLFAALNILAPLYEACLERMERFLAEQNAASNATGFERVLKQVADHPNRRYFVLKTIIINNLFGVDIMAEATEIAKLRLFLKLAAQVAPDSSKPNLGLEPLPDIDFNIQAGNTLVGFASYAEFEKSVSAVATGQDKKSGEVAMQNRLFQDDTAEKVRQKAKDVEREFITFRDVQTKFKIDHQHVADVKNSLRRQLKDLGDTLDRYLASEYGISARDFKNPAD